MVKGIKVTLVSSLVALTLLSGCGGYDNEDKNVVGNNLIITQDTFKPVATLSKEMIQAGLDKVGSDKKALDNIESYVIKYKTKDAQGNEIIASGLITIPEAKTLKQFIQGYKAATGDDFSLSIVSDQHGTIFENKEAPSVKAALDGHPDEIATNFTGVAGFMTVQPDYIGFGESNGTVHPYIIEKPSASATVDMIKAAIAFANQMGLPVNGQVFLSGYSEGGYVTMAAAKDIQQNHPEIHLMAVAPMAGPYDVEQMGLGALTAPQMAFPPFLADTVYAYSAVYSDVNLSDIVVEQYAAKLPTLFNGDHNGTEIYMALPNVYTTQSQAPELLFKKEFIDDFISDKENRLRVHFRENSVIDWKPEMPMKLYHCTNDNIVPYDFSKLAYGTFTQKGSKTVALEPIDTLQDNPNDPLFVHRQCARVAYPKVGEWFHKVRKGEK